MALPAASLVFLESATHCARLVTEYALTDARPRLETVSFTALLLCAAVAIAGPFDAGTWTAAVVDALPVAALVGQLCVVRAFAYAALLAAVVLALQTPLRLDWVLLIGYAAQLTVAKQRSHVLRAAATGALLYACTTNVGASYRRVVALVGLELTSWALERYMLPWRVPASRTACCNHACRFALGFFVGVHVTSGQEAHVLLRPAGHLWLTRSVLGIAIHGDDAYVRYSTRPLGVLLAYVEGLQVIPVRLRVDADARELRVQVAWVDALARFDLADWAPAPRAASFAAASRFPARRLLVGLLLRL